jgi:hypothetical protein
MARLERILPRPKPKMIHFIDETNPHAIRSRLGHVGREQDQNSRWEVEEVKIAIGEAAMF